MHCREMIQVGINNPDKGRRQERNVPVRLDLQCQVWVGSFCSFHLLIQLAVFFFFFFFSYHPSLPSPPPFFSDTKFLGITSFLSSWVQISRMLPRLGCVVWVCIVYDFVVLFFCSSSCLCVPFVSWFGELVVSRRRWLYTWIYGSIWFPVIITSCPVYYPVRHATIIVPAYPTHQKHYTAFLLPQAREAYTDLPSTHSARYSSMCLYTYRQHSIPVTRARETR